jgi:hypothetical protein
MTTLNLTGQLTHVQAALPTFQAFQTQMNLRREVWDKLTPEVRRRWVQSSNGTLGDAKDPVMWLAVQLRRYLNEWEIQEDG